MFNKKVVIASAVSVGTIIVIVFLYYRYWQEPEAEYVETENIKLVQIREDLVELKSELKQKGLYSCCIKNDCNWCAIYMGHCPCAKLVSKKGNEKSCPECAAAWNRKQGKILGVDPDAIQITTFGVYGFEKGGYHHPESTVDKTEHGDHHGLELSGELVDGTRIVKMKAQRFEFSPSKVVVKAGEKVRFEVRSEDVVHGIEIEGLGISRELKPGKMEVITFATDKPGSYHFHCSVYCGKGHDQMHGELVVLSD